MKIETNRFGSMDIDDAKLIGFPWGIPGFEEIRRYVLLEHKDGPFQWLQAVDEPSVAFVVCPPELLGIEYHIPEERALPLAPKNEGDLQVLNLVSFARGRDKIRFHVRSPLLFNTVSRQAYQWSMDADEVRKNVTLPDGLPWTEDQEAW